MFYFVTYETEAGTQIMKFNDVRLYFDWLQKWVNTHGEMPESMCVFTAECIFDGG